MRVPGASRGSFLRSKTPPKTRCKPRPPLGVQDWLPNRFRSAPGGPPGAKKKVLQLPQPPWHRIGRASAGHRSAALARPVKAYPGDLGQARLAPTIPHTLITASGGRRIDYGSANTADHLFLGRRLVASWLSWRLLGRSCGCLGDLEPRLAAF